ERDEAITIRAEHDAGHEVARGDLPEGPRRKELLPTGGVPEANRRVLGTAHDLLAVGCESGGDDLTLMAEYRPHLVTGLQGREEGFIRLFAGRDPVGFDGQKQAQARVSMQFGG